MHNKHALSYLMGKGLSIVLFVLMLTLKMALIECKHCHIVEIGLTLLAQASMPLRFCEEAFLKSVYIINRLPLC